MAYTGVSLTDYLASIGKSSDFASRSALAKANNIQNYTGTAAQNTQLLGVVRGAAPTSPTTPQGGLSMLTGTGANAFTQPSAPPLTSFQAPQVAQASAQQTPQQLAQPTLLGKVAGAIKSQAGNLTANIGSAFGPQPGSGTPIPGPSPFDLGTPGTPGYIPAQVSPQPKTQSATVQPTAQSTTLTPEGGTGFLLTGTDANAMPAPDAPVLEDASALSSSVPAVSSPALAGSTAHTTSGIATEGQKTAGAGAGASSGGGVSGAGTFQPASGQMQSDPLQPQGQAGVPPAPISQTNAPTGQNGAQDGTTGVITSGTNPQEYSKVDTGNVGPDGKPIYDVYGPTGKLDLDQFHAAGLNIDQIPVQQNAPSSGDTGSVNDPITQAVDSLRKLYGLSVPEPGVTPIEQAINDAKTINDALGLTDIKAKFDEVNQQYTDLQNELNDKIQGENDNPWLSEGLRQDRIASLQKRYEGKLDILVNKQKIYDSLYQQGQQQAKEILATVHQTQQQNIDIVNTAIDLVQKQQEAATKLAKLDPSTYKEVQGGLYDISKGEWVIPPKPGGNPTEADKQVYETRTIENTLNASKKGGQFVDGNVYIQQRTRSRMSPSEFDSRFGQLLSPDDRRKYNIGQGTTSVQKAGRLQELLLKSESGQNLDLLTPGEQAELLSLL